MVMEEKARLTLKIHGRVQGVGFRVGVLNQAKSLGLTGWVRNAEDPPASLREALRAGGTVEVVAEGEKETLDRLHKWCQKGPSFSRVEKVEVEREPYRGEFREFTVKRGH